MTGVLTVTAPALGVGVLPPAGTQVFAQAAFLVPATGAIRWTFNVLEARFCP